MRPRVKIHSLFSLASCIGWRPGHTASIMALAQNLLFGPAAFVRRATWAVVRVCLPPQCLACAAPLEEYGVMCPACWREMEFISPPYCARLGLPFGVDPGPGALSAQAIAGEWRFHRARSVARYDGPALKLVQALKYHDRLDLAPHLARLMARAGAELLADTDVIVPVPLYWTRLWRRRFNQSAVLAHALAKTSGIGVKVRALRRIRPTPAQVGLSATQRRRNVKCAFVVCRQARDAIAGRRILVIDDVFTTGATADSCAAALLGAGARRVDVLTFARVVDQTVQSYKTG